MEFTSDREESFAFDTDTIELPLSKTIDDPNADQNV